MAAQPPRPSIARSGGGASSGSGKNDGKVPGTFFLGRYRVVEEIGIGGMASVHLARMDGPGGFQKWVAIKRIHPNLVEDDQFVDMFLDEARIAAGINHANVAQVFDLGKDDNTYWIAMEYIHGEPLREVMRRCEERNQLIGPELAARICADAAEGLHAAHELRGKSGQLLGLVHRDVTPHNLFLTYDGYTKVVDFGIAKVADRLSETRAGTLKGKLAYMSPEQVRAQDDVDRTTDIFALGVVLWELTTGHRLFRMDTDLDTLEKVQACVVPPPSTVVPGYPVELESVVMKALAKKKGDRFQTARELSRALQTYLLRRGVFVGPEEVAGFVRELFGDRIKTREDHLAWAADVTSTINIDQLKGVQISSREDASLKSSASAISSEDGAPTGRRGAQPQGQANAPSNPQSGAPKGKAATGPAPSSAPMGSPSRPAGPPPRVSGRLSAPPPARSAIASTSLIDDDEDVPTTVATRELIQDLGPRPAARPNTQQSVRSTSMGLGLPPPPSQQAQNQQPSFGGRTMAMSPTSNEGQMGPGRPAPTFGPPIAFGPPPGQHGQQQQPGQPHSQPAPLPTFGPPPGMMSSAPPSSGKPPGGGNTARPGPMPQNQQGHPQPLYSNGQSGLPPGAYATGASMGGQYQRQASGAPLPSHIETALSLPRPDPASLWMMQQDSNARVQRKNTAILIAVAVLTAVCVAAICALIYFKYKSSSAAPVPVPDEAKTKSSMTAPSGASPGATGPPATSAAAASTSIPSASSSAAPGVTSAATADDPKAAGTPSGSTTSHAGTTTSPNTAPSKDVGYLTVICKPFCDNVKRNGSSLGSSPIVKSPTPPGQYRITLTRAGSPDRVESVIVTTGETAIVRANMK